MGSPKHENKLSRKKAAGDYNKPIVFGLIVAPTLGSMTGVRTANRVLNEHQLSVEWQ